MVVKYSDLCSVKVTKISTQNVVQISCWQYASRHSHFQCENAKNIGFESGCKKNSNNAAKDYFFRVRTMTILSMLLKEKLVPEKRQNISTLKCLNDPKNEVEGDREKKFHNTATILVFSSLKC